MKIIERLFQSIIHQKLKKKAFNVLIEGKRFLHVTLKNKEAYEKIIEMSKNKITQLAIYWIMNNFQGTIN